MPYLCMSKFTWPKARCAFSLSNDLVHLIFKILLKILTWFKKDGVERERDFFPFFPEVKIKLQ